MALAFPSFTENLQFDDGLELGDLSLAVLFLLPFTNTFLVGDFTLFFDKRSCELSRFLS